MSLAPRSEIRSWIREQLDAGTKGDDITIAAIDHFLEQPDIVGELIADVVKQEAQRVLMGKMPRAPSIPSRQATATVRTRIEQEAAALPDDEPLAKLTPSFNPERSSNILVDLAKMTKFEVANLAQDFESAAQKNEELAAFCHAVAAGLTDDQTVSQAFTREHLLNLRRRMVTHSTTRVYIGERQVAISERTN